MRFIQKFEDAFIRPGHRQDTMMLTVALPLLGAFGLGTMKTLVRMLMGTFDPAKDMPILFPLAAVAAATLMLTILRAQVVRERWGRANAPDGTAD